MARKPTRPRRNKARNSRAAKGASANSAVKAGAKGARRGKPATKSRTSVATRKPAKRIASRSLPKGQRGASARAAPPRAASGRNPPRRDAARLRRAAARAGPGAAVAGVQVTGKPGPRYDEILSPDALAFLAELHRRFDATRTRLLARRAARPAPFAAGELPDFLHQTRHIREVDWKIAAIPKDLLDRRVGITGPVGPEMIINALNSGANVYM